MSVSPNVPAPAWQASFLVMLPAIQRQASRLLRGANLRDREEAVQAIIAFAAVASARLAERNRMDLASPTPLARYGLQRHLEGRFVGGAMNVRDVASARGQRQRGCFVVQLDEWQESLTDARRMTPADLAAFRLDFGAWLWTLTPRNRKLAIELGRGEPTSAVAAMFQLTAGRVSQLRRELEASWRGFVGEPVNAAC